MHLNPNKTQKISRNTLRDFLLQSFSKKLPWFRCSGKGEHLNHAERQNPAAKPLTTNALQDFKQQYPRFRSHTGLECHRMQIRPGGTSDRGFHQTRNRVANASEPERNSKNPLQFIERLPIAKFHQASSLVQMQRKKGASEPERNSKKPLQHIEKLSIAKFHQASPLVQMQWKRGASEPCRKAESGSQPTHNKHIAELSVTVHMVQIPTWVGTQQNANTP